MADILEAIGQAARKSADPYEPGRPISYLLRDAQCRWLEGRIDDEELRMIFDAASAYAGHQRNAPRKTFSELTKQN